ncbi:23S rRNA (adenine(2030)-N(6))-methyltransferase RlmJ [Pararobbsia alpina]|uniref:Ribosomal RNA large subunit methyltransferase J n=1 Tax=Pararobbsia alpina TaxID=621374 RepID=A0A6S7CCI0_9BURK|nr:23S rRNA (adenine(2030)-N(6))-methyltransferase RlmJ [Pararobbsia alpina]CAB3786136.1 Ribosomal RNA large subunit methyltransferase J [Pararobbsia alpina]
MLSYRHAFHAGNHADILKHLTVVQALRYMAQKDKPFWYIDTHAGAGAYALDSAQATKNAEFASGIGALWGRKDAPPAVVDLLDEVRHMNPDGKLRYYPGSPYLAWRQLREQDRLRLFELHPTEIDILRDNFRDAGRRAMLYAGDGFEGIKALLPPPPRRAFVLIDPSYEDKRDYARTIDMLEASLKRFATGTYAVWYPQVQRPEARRFPEQLKKVQPNDWLHVTLSVNAPSADGYGLHGSGMFIVNPPFRLVAMLKETMPYLVDVLGMDDSANFEIESRLS